MTKRKILILIGIVFIVIFAILGYAFLTKPQTTQTAPVAGTNFFTNIFPFLKGTGNIANTILNILNPVDEKPEPQESYLKKISSFPVAGYGVSTKERFLTVPEVSPAIIETPIIPVVETPAPTITGKTTDKNKIEIETKPLPPPTEFIPSIKYTEKATGNIYQTDADKIDERKLSNNIIPTVYESLFGKNGESVIMRYLQGNTTIQTFVRILPKEILGGDVVDTGATPGTFLSENITDMSISPDASQIFYLFNSGNGSVGITANSIGENKVQVFNSPFTEWLSQWPNDRMITLTTKPSFNVPGYMYAVDPSKKDFNKILGGINGLTTLTSTNGQMVLYSNNNLALYIYDIGTGNSRSIGINTLPEKCVWTKLSDAFYCGVPKNIISGQYPDSWYMGEVSFSDEVWYVDAISGNTSLVSIPTNTEGIGEMDITKLIIDDNQNYLFFVNKKDSYLWELSI